VNGVAYPDRNLRPGGRWSPPDVVGALIHLAAIERAAAHAVSGWLPKIPELDDKIRLASVPENSMARAVALRQHALKLLERDSSLLIAHASWIEPLRILDAGAESNAFAHGINVDLNAFLQIRYRALLAQLDELYDARAIASLQAAIEQLSSSPARQNGAPSALAVALEQAWNDESTPPVPLDAVLWRSADRVPVPARPAARARPEPGALGVLRSTSRREPEDLCAELNDNVMAELSAMELLSRCSYDHHYLPLSYHMTLAIHVADQDRHAAIFRRLLAQNGFNEANLPQHGANYEYGYQFPECEIGGKRELIWRVLIMCTVLEALAMDKLPVEIATRDWLGQHAFARALDYIATDELFHTENGLRLTRKLCEQYGFDPMLERERVHGRFFARQRNVRARYLAADPARAAREVAILEGPDPDNVPFASRTQVELRKRASFTDEECDQVERWGYHPPSNTASAYRNGLS
jgi:uncharacterized ferritin-like protein (DUF455 family)